MVWGLALVTAVLLAETLRFLRSESRRRRDAEASLFSGDLRTPTVVTDVQLASQRRAEVLRGAGFLIRINLAVGALMAAVLWRAFGASVWGIAVGRPVGACVALALGFTQCVYLVPAAVVALTSGHRGTLRGLAYASAPFFALSLIGAIWLYRSPAPARQPKSAPAEGRYNDDFFSYVCPKGWYVSEPAKQGPRTHALYINRRGEDALFINLMFWADDLMTPARFLGELRARDRAPSPPRLLPTKLGPFNASQVEVLLPWGEGNHRRVRAFAAPVPGGFFSVTCQAPPERFGALEPACETVVDGFRSNLPFLDRK